jgi:peptide/nickel transport system permease protein
MLRLLISRLAAALAVMAGVVTLVFLLLHVVPGDPVDAMLGESALPADRAALREALGLDRPIALQWADYIAHVLRLDLGHSLQARRPVTELLAERLPGTLQLAAAASGVALLIALPAGMAAALRKGRALDRLAMAASMIGVSIPSFWLGPMLILAFSIGLGWLPVSGNQDPGALLLPALTLGAGLAAILARMTRSAMLEVLSEDYVRTARAMGLSERSVILRHAARNACLPVVTVLGLQLGALLGGAVITETVFAWPGLGSLTIEAIQARDYPVVQGCVLLISLAYVGINLLTDLLYAWADPRLRHAA